jgi:hypothetical protein
MSNLYRGPSIDASYQVSVHLTTGTQAKTVYEKINPFVPKNALEAFSL